MRMTSLTLAAVAALAISAAPLAYAQTGEKQGTTQAEGSKKEQLEGKGSSSGMTSTPKMQSGTTGAGNIGGGVSGSAQKPGGTNNEQTGTQSHDAQKGGSGKDGAR